MKDNLARQTGTVIRSGAWQNHTHAVSIVPEIRDIPQPEIKPWQRLISDEMSLWLSSMLIVLAISAAPFAWWLIPQRNSGPASPPPAAMVVELAPAPVSPASEPDLTPGPKQAEAAPPPTPKPEPQSEAPIPPLPAATKPAVAIASNTKPEEQHIQKKTVTSSQEVEETPPSEKPVSVASAPPKTQQEDEKTAAPNRGISTHVTSSDTIPAWQNTLMLKLNSAKRYPSQARRYRQEGTVYLRFSMDRDGNVLTKSIEQSTGYSLLDKETLALIERAQPLPSPPEEMQEDQLEFVVPVEFFLNR